MGKIVIQCTTCEYGKDSIGCQMPKYNINRELGYCLDETTTPPKGVRAGYNFKYRYWKPIRKEIKII